MKFFDDDGLGCGWGPGTGDEWLRDTHAPWSLGSPVGALDDLYGFDPFEPWCGSRSPEVLDCVGGSYLIFDGVNYLWVDDLETAVALME